MINKLILLPLISLFFSGCVHTHYHAEEQRSKIDFENDRRDCFMTVNKRLNIIVSDNNSAELLNFRDSLIDACMEEDKKWDQDSLNLIFDYKFENYIKKDTE